jgi:NACHT domain/Calcineurin-like phosphoesterase
MGDYFNWLHLTDLHYGQKGQGPLWSNVRQAFFNDLAALYGRCGPWHAVLFTGDLVYSGNAAEFEQLEADVLSRLYAELERLGSGDAVLLAVPGNHDLARPDIRTKIPSNLRQLLRPGGMDEIADEFWIASDTEYHQVIGKALSNYSAWWDKTPWRRGTLIQPGRLSGDFAATLTVGGRRIGIAGLNTTFLQLAGGDYRNRLVWDPEQLRAVSGDPADWAANHDACLLLTHQAGEWLTESARNIAGPEINPAGRFAVHLFGHMHENDLSGLSKGGGQQRFDWQTSSLFGMEKFGEPPGQVDRRHGYAAGRLEFGKKDITIRCWPRTASYDSNGWRLYADHEAGPLKKDEGTKPQWVASVRRTVPSKPKGKRSPGAAAKTTERALLTTYLRAVRGLWDIVDLAGLPEDDRHLAMQKFMLRQLYMPLRMVIEEATDESLLDALEGRRERQRLVSAGRTAKSGDTEVSNARLSVGAWLSDRLAIKTSNGYAKPAAAPRLVVLGDPGGGKSTLLRWLATACLLRLDNSGDFALLPDAQTLPEINWIPILIRCRELDKKTLGQSFLEDLLRQTLPKLELSASYVEELIGLLRDCLETGAAIILIDGLDEITDPSQRIAFCERVEVIAKYYSRVPVLITSRVVGYREMQRRIGAEFAHGTLDDLRPEEKDSFVGRWCDVTITDPQRRVTEADALRRGIHSNDRVARLTGNPMLLTTMALVQRKVGKLPPKRHKLYWEAVDLLLRWRASPDDPPLDSDEALPQLEYLAYTMCDLGVQRLRRDEVLGYLAEMRRAYPDIRPVHRHTPEEFLAILERRTGLLTEMGTVQHDGQPVPVYEFRHLTFQEYLAALSLVRGHFPGHEVGSSLAARIGPLAGRLEEVETPNLNREFVVTENWREALRLCVASCNDDDVSSVLEAILNALDQNETRPRAILAAQCLADEPNVQSAQAVRIIAAFASHIRTEDAGGNALTSLARAAMELRTGDWRAVLDISLVREFLKRPPETRGGAGSLAGMIGLENIRELPEADTGNWLRTKTADLLSASDEEATGAALTIMDAAWARLYGESRATFPLSLPKNLINNLISFLHRGAAMAHAGAWALGWLAEDKEGELWQPTETEREPLLKYLSNPSNDPEALRWVVIIAERKHFAQAGPSIAALITAPSLDLRRAAMRALALVGDTVYFALFRQSLNDADADIRRAALHGLLQNRDEMDRRLFGGDRASTYLWHDPAVAISQGQIIDFSKQNKVSEAAARKRVEMIAQEFDLRIEPNYKRKERKRSKKIP